MSTFSQMLKSSKASSELSRKSRSCGDMSVHRCVCCNAHITTLQGLQSSWVLLQDAVVCVLAVAQILCERLLYICAQVLQPLQSSGLTLSQNHRIVMVLTTFSPPFSLLRLALEPHQLPRLLADRGVKKQPQKELVGYLINLKKRTGRDVSTGQSLAKGTALPPPPPSPSGAPGLLHFPSETLHE